MSEQDRTPLTVRTLLAEEGSTSVALEQALASLPLSFSASDVAADIVAIAGSVDLACFGSKTIALLVAPNHVESVEILAEAATAGVRVFQAFQFSSNPAMKTAQTWSAEVDSYRLESVVTFCDECGARRALLDQLVAAETMIGEVDSLHGVRWDERGYILAGSAGSVRFALSAVFSGAVPEGLAMTLFTADGDVTVKVPAWTSSLPAVVTRTSAAGREEAPSIWETGLRAALRSSAGGGTPTSELLLDARRRKTLIQGALEASSISSLRPEVTPI